MRAARDLPGHGHGHHQDTAAQTDFIVTTYIFFTFQFIYQALMKTVLKDPVDPSSFFRCLRTFEIECFKLKCYRTKI